MKLTTLLSLFSASQLNLAVAQRLSLVSLCRDEEWGDCSTQIFWAGGCYDLTSYFDDNVTGYEIMFGCCAFYRHHGCKKRDFLFSASGFRQHSRLPPYDNDIISSIMCISNCKGEYLNPHEGRLDS